MPDLSVKFQEPYLGDLTYGRPQGEPTVGGLTGSQHHQLRLWEDENRCEADIFPVSRTGASERCLEPKEEGSPYCEEHLRLEVEYWTPTYDAYDSYRDREYE